MGYRLNIYKIKENEKTYENEFKIIYYGTKLYGYNDHEKFLSYIYLVSIGKLEYDSYFDYCEENKLILNKKELTIFINLYMEDYFKYCNWKHTKKEIKEKFKKVLEECLNDINEDNLKDYYLIYWS